VKQPRGVKAPPEVTMADQVRQIPAHLVQFRSGSSDILPRTQTPLAQDHVLAA